MSCIVLVPCLLFLSACSYRLWFTCFLSNHDLPAFCCSSDLIGEQEKKLVKKKIKRQEHSVIVILCIVVLFFSLWYFCQSSVTRWEYGIVAWGAFVAIRLSLVFYSYVEWGEKWRDRMYLACTVCVQACMMQVLLLFSSWSQKLCLLGHKNCSHYRHVYASALGKGGGVASLCLSSFTGVQFRPRWWNPYVKWFGCRHIEQRFSGIGHDGFSAGFISAPCYGCWMLLQLSVNKVVFLNTLMCLVEYFCFHFASVQTLSFLEKNDLVLVRMTLKGIQNGMHPFSVAMDFTSCNYINTLFWGGGGGGHYCW